MIFLNYKHKKGEITHVLSNDPSYYEFDPQDGKYHYIDNGL